MSASPRHAILFDLDGTLLDTLRDLADSGNEVLRGRGFPPHPLEAFRHFVGHGMDQLVRNIFPEGQRPVGEAEIAAVLAEYRAAYTRNWQRTTVPYPGIPELLDALVAQGLPIGVVSNKAHDFTCQCVETFLAPWSWDVILGHREGQPRKPDPAGALEAAASLGVAPRDCLFVGDSDVDMQTACRAGMKAVGVAWGFRSVGELKAAGAETILDRPLDLLALIR